MENVIERLFFLGNSILMLLCVIVGFKMGRRTKGEDVKIVDSTTELTGKHTLNSSDIFTDSVNDGLEGDPNERLKTIG